VLLHFSVYLYNQWSNSSFHTQSLCFRQHCEISVGLPRSFIYCNVSSISHQFHRMSHVNRNPPTSMRRLFRVVTNSLPACCRTESHFNSTTGKYFIILFSDLYSRRKSAVKTTTLSCRCSLLSRDVVWICTCTPVFQVNILYPFSGLICL
jgi:hypothetical protein